VPLSLGAEVVLSSPGFATRRASGLDRPPRRYAWRVAGPRPQFGRGTRPTRSWASGAFSGRLAPPA